MLCQMEGAASRVIAHLTNSAETEAARRAGLSAAELAKEMLRAQFGSAGGAKIAPPTDDFLRANSELAAATRDLFSTTLYALINGPHGAFLDDVAPAEMEGLEITAEQSRCGLKQPEASGACRLTAWLLLWEVWGAATRAPEGPEADISADR